MEKQLNEEVMYVIGIEGNGAVIYSIYDGEPFVTIHGVGSGVKHALERATEIATALDYSPFELSEHASDINNLPFIDAAYYIYKVYEGEEILEVIVRHCKG